MPLTIEPKKEFTDYTQFCKSKNCEHYIKWDAGMGVCESCKLVGQSYYIDQYPEECPFILEIKEFEQQKTNQYESNLTMATLGHVSCNRP